MNNKLITAIQNSQLLDVKNLIEKGADVNYMASGITPLMTAAIYKEPLILSMLLTAGANPNIIGLDGKTVLDIVNSLSQDATPEEYKQLKACLSYLLQSNAQTADEILAPEREIKQNIEKLFALSKKGNKEELHTFINSIENDIFTPTVIQDIFSKAIQEGDTLLITEMKDKGVDVNDLLENGQTPLLSALEHGHKDAVITLLDMGANPSKKGVEGYSAFDYAYQMDFPYLFKTAIETNKSIDSYYSEQKLFKNAIKDVKPFIALAFIPTNQEDKNSALTELLQDYRADDYNLRYANLKNENPSQRKNKRIQIARQLIKSGADVSLKDEDGNNLLMIALKNGHISLLNDFVNAGANVNKKNKYGITPLMLRVGLEKEKVEDDLLTLLNAGADINSESRRGDTAIFLAAEYGDLDAVKLLYKHGAKIETEKRRFEDLAKNLLDVCPDDRYEEALRFITDIKKEMKDTEKRNKIERKKQLYKNTVQCMKNLTTTLMRKFSRK